MLKLSIIIPVYNGATTIEELVKQLFDSLAGTYELEVVLVNDCSPDDNSADVCRDLTANRKDLVFLDLARNFGEHNAVMAGLNHCSGDAAVIMDDDFQNPPSDVIKLVDELAKGYDVVYSAYTKKEHHFFRNIGSRFNGWVASMLIGKPRELYLSSHKAINRFLIDEVVKYQGPYPYIDGLIFRITRNYSTVTVAHSARQQGQSGYTFKKLVSLWLNMFTNFSILPIRLAVLAGLVFSLIGLIAAGVFFVEKLTNPDMPAGWASLIITLLIVSGVQLFTIGTLGEYLGRLFLQVNGQPQFVVREKIAREKRACEKTDRSATHAQGGS